MTSSFADSDCVVRSGPVAVCSLGQLRTDSPRRRGTTGFAGLRNVVHASACSLGFSSFCTVLRPVIGHARIWARHQEQRATTSRNTTAIVTATTTAAATAKQPVLVRVESAQRAETRAIYGRVRQIRREAGIISNQPVCPESWTDL